MWEPFASYSSAGNENSKDFVTSATFTRSCRKESPPETCAMHLVLWISMDRSSHRQTLQTLQESRSEDNIHQGLHTIVQVHPVLKVLDIQAAGWQADFGYALFSILIRHVSSDPYPMI